MRRHPNGVADSIPSYVAPTVRGVVVAVYFADGQEERAVAMRQRDPKFYGVKGVAVDVLTYGGRFRSFLQKVLVVQSRHALNDYKDLWIPRSSTKDLSTGLPPVLELGAGATSDPRDLDGDHVLVEFLENDPSQPFIRDTVPHPRASYTQLKAAGDAVESRFRGVVTRIDTDGNITVDTTAANSGGISATGAETPALDAGHGKLTVRMNHNAPFVLEGVDTAGAGQTFKIEIDPAAQRFRLRLGNGASLDIVGKDLTAIATIGNGLVSAAIAEQLQALWGDFVTWATTTLTVPTGMGPSGPSTVPPPLWDAAINSAHLKLPDNP